MSNNALAAKEAYFKEQELLDIPDDDEFGLGDEWYGSRRASIEASSGVWEDGLLMIQ